MPHYTAPLRDMRFIYAELFGSPDGDADTIDTILAAAGRLAANVLQPLNLPGDIEGCTFDNGIVRAPRGFKEAYRQYIGGGWAGLAASPAHGGQGLRRSLAVLVEEMFCSANLGFSGYTGLAQAAYHVLSLYGTQEQKALYLPKLVQGVWSGTMCLSEPQAGTDLGLIRTRACSRDDGSHAITGAKIFVSGGEHDLTENIVHLVLARLPDAPAGTQGISLFVVPRYLPASDGSVGQANRVRCTAVEHKMGIRSSATCAIDFDGATGWLLGEPHKGMRAMFAMMNTARLAVAVQGLGLAEVAYQNALAYAKERRQGRAAPNARQPENVADPIIVHPDVRKNLLTMKALTEGVRALTMWVACNLDRASGAHSPIERQQADDLVQLLTPIAKSFGADVGFEVTNLGVQIFGGHGYIREHGMEQFARDARIAQLYEGTNGIQALDLVGRKFHAHDGRYLQVFLSHIETFIEEHSCDCRMDEFVNALQWALGCTRQAVAAANGTALPDETRAVATDVLRLFGYVSVGYMWGRMAAVALAKGADDHSDFYGSKLKTARFYMQKLLPQVAALLSIILTGGSSITDFREELFDSADG